MYTGWHADEREAQRCAVCPPCRVPKWGWHAVGRLGIHRPRRACAGGNGQPCGPVARRRQPCVESSATWAIARRNLSWSRACAGSNIADMTAPASPRSPGRTCTCASAPAASPTWPAFCRNGPRRAARVSATRAGPRTAPPTTATPIRTSLPTARSPSYTTASSRITPSLSGSSSKRACCSTAIPTPRSSPSSSNSISMAISLTPSARSSACSRVPMASRLSAIASPT